MGKGLECNVSLSRPRVRTTVVVVLILGAVYLGGQALDRSCRPGGNDLNSFLLSARALVDGGDPYATASHFGYLYPLFLTFLLIPLAGLPCGLAAAVWYLAGLAALAASLILLARLASPAGGRERSPPVAAFLLLLLICFDVLQNNVVNGQVNFLVLLCCVGYLVSLQNGRPLPAALCLGAAIAIKLVPAVLLVHLLVRRRPGTALGAVIAAGVLCLLPGLLPGVDVGALYVEYYRSFLAVEVVQAETPPRTMVVYSVYGMLAELAPDLRGLAWGKVTVALLILAALAVRDFQVARPWVHRPAGAESGEPGPAAVFSFAHYLLVMLLISPMSEVHHLAFALPALTWFLIRWLGADERRAGWLLAAGLLLYLIESFERTGLLYFFFLVLLWSRVFVAAPATPAGETN